MLYTFNALKADPALDLNALWSVDSGPLTNVALQGTNQVVFTFNAPAQSYFYYVADQTPIIPQHIWSSLNQTKLDTEADTTPVGTGPYLMSNCSQDNIKYLRNTHYWQSKPGHPVPQVAEVDYPAFLSNTSANLYLAQGQAQWGAQYIPNIQSYYISKNPSTRHYWFPPTLNVSLFPNLTNPLLGNLAVRQAIAMAIDRAPGLAARRERLRAGGEPDRHRPADLQGVVREVARHARPTAPPRRSRPSRPPASPRDRTASTRTRRVRSFPSPSRRSVATRTGTRHCR